MMMVSLLCREEIILSGRVRRFFPGGNSSEGFYSFFDFFIEPDVTRLFILKGGPGVGKSTFMRNIGEKMLKKGYDIEYHHCASDSNSLDGIVINDLKVAILDGTTPHIVDPKFPGVVDEIVNLGEFWNEKKLLLYKEEIIEISTRMSRFFKTAYSSLKEAKVIQDEWESYITEGMDFVSMRKITHGVNKEVFGKIEPDFESNKKARHLFASGITPQGSVNFLASILSDIEKIYLLKGEPGSGKSTFMNKMAEKAQYMGFFVEIYHCPLDPQKIDFVVIPKLGIAFINDNELIKMDGSNYQVAEIDFNKLLDSNIMEEYEQEILDCKKRFWSAYYRAIEYIKKAKLAHDELEGFYVPNMDFSAINKKQKEVLEKIEGYRK